MQISNKAVSEQKTMTVQDGLGRIIDPAGRNLCFLGVYMGNRRYR